jgi:hypothetical protein
MKFKHKRKNNYNIINLTDSEFKNLRRFLESKGFKLYGHGNNEYLFLNKMRSERYL